MQYDKLYIMFAMFKAPALTTRKTHVSFVFVLYLCLIRRNSNTCLHVTHTFYTRQGNLLPQYLTAVTHCVLVALYFTDF